MLARFTADPKVKKVNSEEVEVEGRVRAKAADEKDDEEVSE